MQLKNIEKAIPNEVSKVLDKKMGQLKGEMLQAIEAERELIEFELLMSSLIYDEKLRKKVIMRRKRVWKKSLKKANGDVVKAFAIFDEEYPPR